MSMERLAGYEGLDWLWLRLAAVMDVPASEPPGRPTGIGYPAGYPGSYAEKDLYDPVTGQACTSTPATPAAPDQTTDTKPQYQRGEEKPMAIKTYKDGTPFTGVIGRTTEESSPAWPEPPRPPEGAPNVLFFVLDDVGYGQLSSFGGLVETPVLDSVAANGLRYTNMHTTALCSPSRSCILTGRNHHSIGLASITETSTGYPGYNGILPFDKGMLSEMLVQKGYNTFCVGKWHLTPPEHLTAAGPYDRWPLGRGFERFYGFMGGETNQWYPELTYDNHEVEQPKSPEEGYHLSVDLADKAIEFIQDAQVNAPDKPFFLYYATGAGHAPHHVPKEWADKYKGKFDMGWDKYRGDRPPAPDRDGHHPAGHGVVGARPGRARLGHAARRGQATICPDMEVYAGFVSFTDYHFGRILEFLREISELDNTLIVVISDNGASSEGGPVGSLNEMFFFNNVPESLEANLKMIDELGGVETCNHYPWGWTNGGNTPFRRWKRETYRGGTTDPCIVSWPKGIQARGELRPHYGHVIDFVPQFWKPLARRRRRAFAASIRRRSMGSASPTRSTRRLHPAITTRSTSRCSGTARSITMAGGRPARGRARASPRPPRRAASSALPFPTKCSWISRRTTGSCTTSTKITPNAITWLPSTATS